MTKITRYNGKERRGGMTSFVDKRTLEDFPHVLEKVQLFWGEPEFIPYYKSLTQTNCERAGFPNAVVDELNMLYNLYIVEYRIVNPRLTDSQIIDIKKAIADTDIWDKNHSI